MFLKPNHSNQNDGVASGEGDCTKNKAVDHQNGGEIEESYAQNNPNAENGGLLRHSTSIFHQIIRELIK